MQNKNNNISPQSTMLVITTGFILLYILTRYEWALFVSLSVGITGIISPFISKKINFFWMKLAWVLGLVIPNIILGIVFYFFLFPISLLSKLFNPKDQLSLKNDKASFFKIVNKQFEKSTFEKMW